jgi:hypothetical protein
LFSGGYWLNKASQYQCYAPVFSFIFIYGKF